MIPSSLTPLTTPFLDFHKVISALTSPTTTPTPSLVKTSLEGLITRAGLAGLARLSCNREVDFYCVFMTKTAEKPYPSGAPIPIQPK